MNSLKMDKYLKYNNEQKKKITEGNIQYDST